MRQLGIFGNELNLAGLSRVQLFAGLYHTRLPLNHVRGVVRKPLIFRRSFLRLSGRPLWPV
jgi:hypothetical protein